MFKTQRARTLVDSVTCSVVQKTETKEVKSMRDSERMNDIAVIDSSFTCTVLGYNQREFICASFTSEDPAWDDETHIKSIKSIVEGMRIGAVAK